MKEENIVAKLIKMFVTQNPNCTAREIYEHLRDNSYGLKSDYTAAGIGKIIQRYNAYEQQANTYYDWFNITIIREKGKPLKYKVKP